MKNIVFDHVDKAYGKNVIVKDLNLVFPFGINRYRAGAKVWQRALEIKGQAFGFRKNLHTVG